LPVRKYLTGEDVPMHIFLGQDNIIWRSW